MSASLNKLRDDLRLVRGNEIARRYLVLNALDGVLATLGIIAGAYFAGVADPKVVVVAGLGASAAMGLSGAWGAYMTEKAERARAIRELERQLFTSLSGSNIEHASRTATLLIALVDGLAPLATSLVCLSPLLFTVFSLVSLTLAVEFAVAFALVILFSLGLFLGRVAGSSFIKQGVLMVVAGLLIFGLVYILGVG